MFSLWITRTRLSAAAKASQIPPEPSRLPSLARMSSKSVNSWFRTLSTQRRRDASALYTGTMMLTHGSIGNPS